MTKMDSAELLDSILLRFTGNSSVKWADLREEFKTNMHQYHVTENNIKRLTSDGMLVDHKEIATLNLTDRGFATMVDISNSGYVVKEQERRKIEKKERRAFVISVLGLSVACLSLGNTIFHKTPDVVVPGLDSVLERQLRIEQKMIQILQSNLARPPSVEKDTLKGR
jgi:hypothetical protein